MAKKKTKSYPEAFRRQAVKLADYSDRTVADVARELGTHPGQIYNWRTQCNKLSKGQSTVADGTNYSVAENAEIRKLKKEIADLKEDRDFLKTHNGVLCKTRRIKYALIESYIFEYRVTMMCRLLQVSRSWFYVFLKRHVSTRQQRCEQVN